MEKEAIDICQSSKTQGIGFVNTNTWLDAANQYAKENPNLKCEWHATKIPDSKFYLVDFTGSDGWGSHWEVDVEQKIVKDISQSEYLKRKYDLTRFTTTDEFEVTNLAFNQLKLDKYTDLWTGRTSYNIVYTTKASVLNKTSKTITDAKITGNLKLIFKDKTVIGSNNYESGFLNNITEDNPWKPKTSKEFYIKTKGIDKLYLEYIPEYIVYNISLKVGDPTGYKFDQDLTDQDLKDKWIFLRTNKPNNQP